jgi:hypothetical protein
MPGYDVSRISSSSIGNTDPKVFVWLLCQRRCAQLNRRKALALVRLVSDTGRSEYRQRGGLCMKLTFGLVLLAVVAVALTAPRMSFPQPITPITVYANGRILNFDVPPTIIQGRVLVPLRVIFESLGATVDYNPVTQQINATDGSQNVQLTVDSRQALVDGVPEMLDVTAFAISPDASLGSPSSRARTKRTR